MSNSTPKNRKSKPKSGRPPKPYPDFPLSPHASGAWQKKIRGRIFYFGRWGRRVNGKMERLPDDGWKEALEIYKAQADDLHAGRTPREVPDGELTLKELCNKFLTSKANLVASNELSPRSLYDYQGTLQMMCDFFGKEHLVSDLRPSDFAELRSSIAKRCGPVRIGTEITRIKTAFIYAVKNELIEKPVSYGTEFEKPRDDVMKKHRANQDKKLFTVEEVRQLIWAGDPMVQVAVLLGINCGLGNNDISTLQRKHLDLDHGWLDFPRPKNGNPRRIPLWPITVEHLRTAIDNRAKAKDQADEGAVFLTTTGKRLVRITEASRFDQLGKDFSKVMSKLEINSRQGLGFYSLRHTFATIGLQTGDRDAVKSLMGHSAGDILAVYDETGPSDERLIAITDHVREWLFAGGVK